MGKVSNDGIRRIETTGRERSVNRRNSKDQADRSNARIRRIESAEGERGEGRGVKRRSLKDRADRRVSKDGVRRIEPTEECQTTEFEGLSRQKSVKRWNSKDRGNQTRADRRVSNGGIRRPGIEVTKLELTEECQTTEFEGSR
ncbi:hypothetical protein BJ508DRAFT_306488 [Ascobolus immersus RN42]|uniref:Uncharacterized protein n=1 Tax=Ascobolus immersus RN42 TaxID=1160509 RepID=A0A3N4I7I9_ASCIM|nr:hypothetical protein BJ508DRAFT_306488 [Ascobolus immersus RN42]